MRDEILVIPAEAGIQPIRESADPGLVIPEWTTDPTLVIPAEAGIQPIKKL